MLSVIGEESPGGMSMHHGGGLPAAMVSQAGPVPLDFGMDRMDPTGMEHHMQSTASDAAAPQGGLHQGAAAVMPQAAPPLRARKAVAWEHAPAVGPGPAAAKGAVAGFALRTGGGASQHGKLNWAGAAGTPVFL